MDPTNSVATQVPGKVPDNTGKLTQDTTYARAAKNRSETTKLGSDTERYIVLGREKRFLIPDNNGDLLWDRKSGLMWTLNANPEPFHHPIKGLKVWNLLDKLNSGHYHNWGYNNWDLPTLEVFLGPAFSDFVTRIIKEGFRRTYKRIEGYVDELGLLDQYSPEMSYEKKELSKVFSKKVNREFKRLFALYHLYRKQSSKIIDTNRQNPVFVGNHPSTGFYTKEAYLTKTSWTGSIVKDRRTISLFWGINLSTREKAYLKIKKNSVYIWPVREMKPGELEMLETKYKLKPLPLYRKNSIFKRFSKK